MEPNFSVGAQIVVCALASWAVTNLLRWLWLVTRRCEVHHHRKAEYYMNGHWFCDECMDFIERKGKYDGR
jgi:hypothetical protein